MSTTYSGGFLHYISMLHDTVARTAGSKIGIIPSAIRFFVGKDLVLSMNMVLCTSSSSILMTWFFRSMTVNGRSYDIAAFYIAPESSCPLQLECVAESLQKRMVWMYTLVKPETSCQTTVWNWLVVLAKSVVPFLHCCNLTHYPST